MSVNSLTNAIPYYSTQSQWGQSNAASSMASQGVSANQSGVSTNSDQVTLSDAARALQAQEAGASGAQSGSPDISQEEQLLITLTDKALGALGIVSAADESGTKVTFDSLSYNVSSSASISVGRQQSGTQGQNGNASSTAGTQTTAQFSTAQDATLVGEGHIVTSDGRDFEFQIELQVGQSEQASPTGSVGNAVNGATATTAPGALSQPQPSDLMNQLLDAMQQTSAASNGAGLSSQAGSSAANAGVAALNSGFSQPSQSSTSSTAINWDAILKQTKSLFDLLDSMAATATPNQTPVGTTS